MKYSVCMGGVGGLLGGSDPGASMFQTVNKMKTDATLEHICIFTSAPELRNRETKEKNNSL